MGMWVQSLALFSGLRIRCCCELCCRSQTLLGSYVTMAMVRLVAIVPIRPLAQESPYATGVALEKAERQKKKKVIHTCCGKFGKSRNQEEKSPAILQPVYSLC